jgi:anti-anti-sigma regulatory factor
MPQNPAKLFEVEQAGAIVVIIPQADLSEFAFQQLEAEASEVLGMLDQIGAKSVVIDCCKSTYFGSVAMAFFMKLWLRVRRCSGRMAFCNMSDHEKEILHITKADSLWSMCSSRKEALEAAGA